MFCTTGKDEVLSVTIIICPECGKALDTEKHDIAAHGISHWSVPPKDVGLIRNPEAQRRYRELLQMATPTGGA
jgi:hypothetical protein